MTSAALSEFSEPDLGKYRLIAELARGGMGNVYLAVAQGPAGFNKLLVVKELKPELCDDEHYVAMFMEEARLAARLTHPNIVQTNEVGSDGGRHFMTMEYLDGRSLYRVVRHLSSHGGLPVAAQLRVISEALLGLHYAHELRGFGGEPLGIVHRDVSPLNVVVTFDGQAKVLDFGIAKAVDSPLETQAGVLKGRIAYMSPERLSGDKVDRRADVYAAGVMVWEAAAGRRLWPQKSEVEILTQILRDGPPPLRSVVPTAPADLDAICARALARAPEDRYPTADALRADLDAHLARRPDVMSMREVGALVGAAFQSEREKMNAVIEETLARARGTRRSVVGTPFPGPSATSGTHSVPVSRSRPVAEDIVNVSSILAATPSRIGSGEAPWIEASVADLLIEPEARPRRMSGSWIGLLVAAGLASAASAGFFAHRYATAPAQSAAAESATAGASAAPAPAVVASTIDLVVRATPAGAAITLDGELMPGDPVHVRVPRDATGAVHRVTATADGYEAKVEDVVLESDTSIDVSLDPKPPGARPAGSSRWVAPVPVVHPARAPHPWHPVAAEAAPGATAAPAAPAAQAEPEPSSNKAPLRPILTSNPYGVQ